MTENINLPDQAERDQIKTSTGTNFIVEAAAGTGKTRSLSDRIMTLIEEGTDIEKISAITFTRKAAGELANRIRRLLSEKAEETGDNNKFKNALKNLPAADISTIHSFCENILKEFPVESRIDPDFEVIDKASANRMFEELWNQFWLKLLEENDEFIEKALFFGLKYNEIKETVEKRIKYRDLNVPQAEKVALNSPDLVLDKIEKYIKLIKEKKSDCTDKTDDGFKKCNKILEKHKIFTTKLEKLTDEQDKRKLKINYILSFKPVGSKDGAMTRWDPDDSLRKLKNNGESIVEKQEDYRENISSHLYHHIKNMVEKFLKYFNKKKRKHSVVDFTDILIDTRNLLKENPDIRKRLAGRYDKLLVDEFQDTDPLQAEIVFYLSQEPDKIGEETDKAWFEKTLKEGKLFLVGDPKQSIYRFRRADITIYEKTKRQLTENIELSANFRSRPGILKFINSLFGEDGRIEKTENIQPGYVSLEPSGYIKNSDRENIIGVEQDYLKSTKVDPIISEEAFSIARLLKNLIDEKYQIRDPKSSVQEPEMIDLKPEHIMLLTTKRTHYGVIRSAFEQEDFYIEPDKENIYEGTVIPRMIEFIRAITRPDDKVALTGILRSLFFGVNDEVLFKSALKGAHFNLNYLLNNVNEMDESIKHTLKVFKELRGIRAELSPEQLIKKAIDKTGGHIIAALGNNRSADLRRLENLKNKLTEKVEETLSLESALEETVQNLEEIEVENLNLVEENKIRMMTVHQAKGLEAPVVVLIDSATGLNGSVDCIPIREDDRVLIKYSMSVSFLDDKLKLVPQNWEDKKKNEEKHLNAEFERKRYVAATRARDLLVAPVNNKKYNKDKYFIEPVGKKIKDLAGKWNNIKISKASELIGENSDNKVKPKYITDYNDIPFLPDTKNITREPDEGLNQEWNSIKRERNKRINKLGENTVPVIAVTKKAEEIRKDEDIPQLTSVVAGITGKNKTFGKEGGTYFHNLYETLLKYPALKKEKLIKYCLNESEKFDADNKSLIEKSKTLLQKWKDSDIYNKLLNTDNLFIETPFYYQDEEKNVIYSGKIDILFKEDGEWSIIDLKSDLMYESVKDKPEVQRALKPYRFQLKIYKKAIEKITGEKVKETELMFLDK